MSDNCPFITLRPPAGVQGQGRGAAEGGSPQGEQRPRDGGHVQVCPTWLSRPFREGFKKKFILGIKLVDFSVKWVDGVPLVHYGK